MTLAKSSILGLLTLLLSLLLFLTFNNIKADALSGKDFNPGNIISDSVFYNKSAMSPAQIQQFLNSKVPNCDTNGTQMYNSTQTRAQWAAANNRPLPPYICLKDFSQTVPAVTNGGSDLCKNSISGGTKSAAQIIWDVSQACGINPQVLIVMLQKEMSLVTDNWPWPTQYDKAMGYACPDSGPNFSANCDSAFFGFFNQVYNAAQAYRRYEANPGSYNYRAGRNNFVLYNPNTACGGTNIFIQNQATASLYIYTPYQPNAAALNNLYGTDDSCSAYGNRNFWRLFNDWFGPSVGTPFFRLNNSDNVYINGSENNYYRVPSHAVLKAYGYNIRITYIENKPTSYVSGRSFDGDLPYSARFQGPEIYLLNLGGIHHFTTMEDYNSFGFTLGDEAKLPESIKSYFAQVSPVRTIVINQNGPEVYLVSDGKKQHIGNSDTYNNSGNPVYSSRPTVRLSGDYLNTLSEGAPLLLGNIYLLSNDTGQISYWDGSILYKFDINTSKNLDLVTDYVNRSQVINLLNVYPSEATTLVKTSGNSHFVIDNNRKLPINNTNLSLLGLNTNEFTVFPGLMLDRIPNSIFSNYVRIDGGIDIFSISNRERLYLYGQSALKDLNVNISNVINISRTTSNIFPYTNKFILPSGTFLRLNSSDPVFYINQQGSKVYINSPETLRDYNGNFNNVINLSTNNIIDYINLGVAPSYAKDDEGKLWLLNNRVKHAINSEVASEYEVNVESVPQHTKKSLSRFKSAGTLSPIIRSTSDSKVYKVEAGFKRWITSPTLLFSLGYSWDDVDSLTERFVSSIPSGANITP